MYKIIVVFLMIITQPFAFADDPIFVYDLLDAIAISEQSKKPILVIFTAQWCKNCIIMKDDILQHKVGNDMIIAYIDIDNHKDVAKEYRVRSIPDYFIMQNNIELKRRVGYNNYTEFRTWLYYE